MRNLPSVRDQRELALDAAVVVRRIRELGSVAKAHNLIRLKHLLHLVEIEASEQAAMAALDEDSIEQA
jgi:hypothetical protein